MIENGKTEKPVLAINLLAKYYRQIKNLSGNKLYDAINDFMKDAYTGYDTARWSKTVDNFIRLASKHKLSEIEYIPITKNELTTISSLNEIKKERLLFSMLCFAKLYNTKNSKNNGWVNADIRDISKAARVSESIAEREHLLYELIQGKYIQISSKSGNKNMRVLFVDSNVDSEIMLEISDFRELGYEYMNWKNGGYFRCEECGILCKQNKKGTRKYCNGCIGNYPMEVKKIACIDCGKEFTIDSKDNQTIRCHTCYKKYISQINSEKYRSKHPDEFKTIVCKDCGCEFTVPSKDNQTDRCPECYKAHLRNQWALASKKYRDSKKHKSS